MLWNSPEAPHVLLIGSLHMLDRELPSWVAELGDEADAIIFEVDLSEESLPPELPEGQTISGLSPALGHETRSAALQLGLDPEWVDRLYPWAAAMQLSGAMARTTMRPELGVENILRPRAKHSGWLETKEEFNRLVYFEPSIPEQLLGLQRSLDRLPDVIHRMNALSDAWLRGDIQAIGSLFETAEMAAECPTLFAGLFKNRNALWAARAKDYISHANRARDIILVVVGCGHFVGLDSFPQALVPYGYHFEQCSVPG